MHIFLFAGIDKMKYIAVLLALTAAASAFPHKQLPGVVTVLPEKPTEPAVYTSNDAPSVPVVKRDEEAQKEHPKVEEQPKPEEKEVSKPEEVKEDSKPEVKELPKPVEHKEEVKPEHKEEVKPDHKEEVEPAEHQEETKVEEPAKEEEKHESVPAVSPAAGAAQNEELVRTKRAPLILTKLFLAKGLGLGLG